MHTPDPDWINGPDEQDPDIWYEVTCHECGEDWEWINALHGDETCPHCDSSRLTEVEL